jgi:hypothetical protein
MQVFAKKKDFKAATEISFPKSRKYLFVAHMYNLK